MKRIYKYKLEIRDIQDVFLPIDCEMLSVQVNHGQPCLWALVPGESGVPEQPRTIYCIGTGHNILIPLGKFLGTVQMMGGPTESDKNIYVFHFFEAI